MQCPCNIQAASTLRFTAPRAHPCSHYNAICTRTLQNTVEEPITRRYVHRRLQPLYTRKTQCFVLRLPLQHESHATFMQPLHCVLQQHVHIHAAITMRFASTRCRTPWKNRLRVETTRNRLTQELPFIAGCSHFTRKNTRFDAPASSRKQPHATSMHHCNAFCSNMCTFMQPLQCDLHPHVAERHGRTDCASKRPATASHRSCPSSPAAATLREETQCFVPCNIHAAITLRFAATRAHSCSHYNAISIHTLQNTMEEPIARRNDPQPPHTGAALHRRLQPLYAKKHNVSCHATFMQPLHCVLQQHVHIHAAITMRFASTRCRTPWKNWLRVETARNRLTQELPLTAGCSHFTGKNTRFAAPASSRKQPHATSMHHYNAFCSITWQTCMYLRTWQQSMKTSCGHYTAICTPFP